MKKKYRIKIETRADGRIVYHPQFKRLFFWWDIACYSCLKLESAKDIIDAEIKSDLHRKVKAKSYTKYPL